MKTTLKLILSSVALPLLFIACADKTNTNQEVATPDTHTEEATHEEGLVSLTAMQREAIGLKLGEVQTKNLSSHVKAPGKLEVPPQGKASISTLLGGNVYEIGVIEGDKVQKGQTLALLENPEFVELQVDLQAKASQLYFLQKKYERKQNLYEQQVGSGKAVEEAKANYLSAKAQVEGLKAKMNIFHLDPQKIINGEIYRYIPIVSPISGFVKEVNINLGQFVSPQGILFGVVDPSHIHADLMVFEKDVYKIEKGQKVRINIANAPEEQYVAEIFSVGKTFEEDPKAVHIHAEIIGSTEGLIPGMYVEGRINVNDTSVLALPESAIVSAGNESFIFVKTGTSRAKENAASTENNEAQETWTFKMVPVVTGVKDQGWVEVKLFEALEDGAQIAYNAAYKLISEKNKSETGHHH